MAYLQFDPDLSAVRLDSPVVRAHVNAAGAPKNRETDPALGRSRNDFGTQARALVEAWTGAPRPRLLADRAYDGDAFRAWRTQRGAEAVIPARKGRTNPQPHALERYKARNAVERGIGWLQRGRRVATRYNPYAQRFLGFLYLVGAWIWLQSYLNTIGFLFGPAVFLRFGKWFRVVANVPVAA